MKKLLLLFFIISYSAFGQKNDKNIPAEVRNAFVEKHPEATVSGWKYRRREQLYIATYYLNTYNHKAFFSSDGKWLRTEKYIKRSELPYEVWNNFQKTKYFRWEIFEIKEYQTDHQFLYMIVIQQPGYQNIYLKFLPDGTEVRDDI